MKRILLLIAVFIGLMFLPFLLVKEKEKAVVEVVTEVEVDCPILIEVKGEQEKIPLEEYVLGVVAAEMPISFHEEALKAQSIAARTYVLRETDYGKRAIDPTVQKQVYASIASRQEKWGSSFEENEKRLEAVVEATEGQVIVYKNQLITAMFFSTSNGHTESAANYSGYDIPYLVSVPSMDEELYSKNMKKQFEFTGDRFAKAFGLQWSAGLGKTLKITKTESNRVKEMELGGERWTGRDVRDLLGLPSTDFEITFHAEKVVVETVGYGHGVGMSQYGAQVLANDSREAKEILSHYYTGTEIKNFSPCLKSP